MWVPFNEGWGQYASYRISAMVKEMDPGRLVNTASGWSLRNCGDIYDLHMYEEDMSPVPNNPAMASVLGEFGGIGHPVEGHLWNPESNNWGYQTYSSATEAWKAYKHKLQQIISFKNNHSLSAAIYTQTSDVESEVNGLLTYDREVIKFPLDSLNKYHQMLYQNGKHMDVLKID